MSTFQTNPQKEKKINSSNKQKQFKANSQYFTISVYAVAVILIGAIIIKLILSWNETVQTLKTVTDVLMPFIIGTLLAFILNPAVKKLCFLFENYLHIKHEHLRKILSIAITYFALLGLLAILIFGVVPQLATNLTELVNYVPTMVNQLYHFVDNLEQYFPDLDMDVVRTTINNALPDMVTSVRDFATNLVPAIYQASMLLLQWTLNLIIAIIVSIYMLSDKKPLKNSFKAIVFAVVPIKHIRLVMEVLREAYRLFSSFIIGKAIDSMIIGLLCFLLMTLFRFPYALLISVIIGITNMIPYFGPFIGAIPGVLIMLLISPLKALLLIVLIVVLQQFDGLYLGPKILGDSTGLKPLWIIIAITLGGSIGGVLGMFLGVPVVAFFRYLLNRFLTYCLKRKGLEDKIDTPLE